MSPEHDDPNPSRRASHEIGGGSAAPASAGSPFVALAPLLVALVVLIGIGLGVGWPGGGGGATRQSAATESDATRIPRLQRAAEDLADSRLPGPVAVTRLDADDLRELIDRLSAADPDPTLGPGFDDLFHLMGVLRAGQRLPDVVAGGLADQAAGVYDPRSDRLYLVRRSGTDATDSTIVHEIVHAVQDRRHPLDTLMKGDAHDVDGMSAVQALIEGDATEVQTRFLRRAGAPGILSELAGSLRQLSGTQFDLPPYLQRSLEFPYTQGSAFVTALREQGGRTAVDRAFRDPPRTTLAIMQPERYVSGRDAPVAVSMPAARAGMRRVVDTTFGASQLWALTGDHAVAVSWHGGRVTVDRRGRRGTLTLRITTSDPRAVAAALVTALPRSAVVTVDGSMVTAVNHAALNGGWG